MIKGIIFDYDKTLYSHKLKFVPNLTLKTLRKLKDKGIKLALCTSREQCELKDLDKDIVKMMDLIIAGNGSTIIKDNQIIEKNPISPVTAKKVIDYLNDNNLSYHYSEVNGNVFFVNEFDEEFLKEIYEGNLSEFIYKEYQGGELLNIQPYFPTEKQLEEIKELVASELEINKIFIGPQLAKKGINKGYGARLFMEMFNLTKEETLSVGDALSDIAMFKETAISISTIDAFEEVRNASTHIMPLSIEEGGLNRLLIQLGIIEKEPYDIKIFFLDVDYTIYDHSIKNIRPKTLAALKELKEKGYILFANSGRSFDEMQSIPKEALDLLDGMVLSNGANYVLNGKHYFKPIDIEASKPVTDYFVKNDMFFRYVTVDNKTYYSKYHERVDRYKVYYQLELPIKAYEDEQLIQFIFYSANEQIEQEVGPLFDNLQRTKLSNGSEVARKGVTKASTMLKITELLGLKPENICAFGDSNNDTEMLQEARLSVAMGNGCLNCKKAATFICPDISDDGFYKALKHFKFID